jgi:membrane protease subunit HflK
MEDMLGGMRPGQIRSWALWLVLILIGISLVSTGFYTVEADSEAVVLRFGEYVRTTGPGIHLRLPFGIEVAYPVPVRRVLKEEFGFRTERADVRTTYSQRDFSDESLMLTGDLNIANVAWVVQYKIDDPAAYLFNVRDVPSTLRDASEAVMRQKVGDRSVDEVLKISREEIGTEVKVLLQELLDVYKTGIDVVTVQLQSVDPPQPVEPSFNEVNQALQQQQRITNEAWEIYNKEVPEAEGRANRLVAEARGYAINRTNTARGDSVRFASRWQAYSRSSLTRQVTRQRLFLETMSDVMPDIKTKYVVDESQTGILPLLQLDRAGGDAR